MLRLCLTLALVALALSAMGPRLARADLQQQQSFIVWHKMQDCARYAAKQSPDHTPQGNAKREAVRQDCLRLNRLPIDAPPRGR
jgi:hypothetical protein